MKKLFYIALFFSLYFSVYGQAEIEAHDPAEPPVSGRYIYGPDGRLLSLRLEGDAQTEVLGTASSIHNEDAFWYRYSDADGDYLHLSRFDESGKKQYSIRYRLGSNSLPVPLEIEEWEYLDALLYSSRTYNYISRVETVCFYNVDGQAVSEETHAEGIRLSLLEREWHENGKPLKEIYTDEHKITETEYSYGTDGKVERKIIKENGITVLIMEYEEELVKTSFYDRGELFAINWTSGNKLLREQMIKNGVIIRERSFDD